jgi:protein-S-isoprenylcysteine O-methyltransferase Ste14
MNIGTMGGVVVMQMLVGAILRAMGADASAYRAAFVALALLQLAVAAWYLKAAPETRKAP